MATSLFVTFWATKSKKKPKASIQLVKFQQNARQMRRQNMQSQHSLVLLSPVKQLAMSTYDMLIKKGKELGFELGEEKKAREVVLALLLEFPEFSNARIAALAKVEEAFVKALRA